MGAEAQLETFIARFTPEIATLAEAVLAKLRRRLPFAIQLVYDNYNALAIGFGPTERTTDAVFSIAVYPGRVNLCFLQGGSAGLADPGKWLQGRGRLNRFIPLTSAATLDEPDVQALIAQAIAATKIPFDETAPGHLIIKSVSAKQRPRRPG